MGGKELLPVTLQRSPVDAQEAWMKAYDEAVSRYGEHAIARAAAFAVLKRDFEKVGGRWEARAHPHSSEQRTGQPGPYLLRLATALQIEDAERLTTPVLVDAVRNAMGLLPMQDESRLAAEGPIESERLDT